MTDRELMQQALEALDGTEALLSSMDVTHLLLYGEVDKTITALRERLAQPEQQPVAWMNPSWIDPDTRGWASDSFNSIHIEGYVPVYTAPRQWQGLTDDDIAQAMYRADAIITGPMQFKFAREIEAKLKEKNT